MTEALVAAYPGFGAALALYDSGDFAAATERLHPLSESADPYLAAHATYFKGRVRLADEDYEQALPAFAKIAGEWRDRTLYLGECLFLVGVCQAELLERTAATRAFADFLKYFPGAPERLRVGAASRMVEIRNVEEGSLTDIEDRMDDSRRRLALTRSGRPTQQRQKEIVDMLDDLIELAEQAEGGGGGGGGGGGQSGGQSGGQQGGSASGASGGAPASASSLPGGESSRGRLDKIRRGAAEESWGDVRKREREQVMNVLKSRFPEQYRELIEQYYRGLQHEK
jgi:TolA-binding protein